MKDIRSKLILGGFIGAAVLVVLLIYTNLQEVGSYVRDFPLLFVLPIVLLTLFNYIGRWAKWQYYLHLIGVENISYVDSAVLWVSGFVLAITPGKVGELLKAVVLRSMTGTPVARSAPVIIAERLTDGLAMFVLAAIGAGGILFTSIESRDVLMRYLPAYLIILGVIVAALIVLQIRPLAIWVLNLLEKLPIVGSFASAFHELYDSAALLLKPVPLMAGVTLGVVSWSGEAVGFFLILWGMGLEPSWLLLWQATFILGIYSIIGAVSGLPGGLGAAEVTIVGMVQVLVLGYEDAGFAGTASLFVRISTLWFAVVLGLVTAFIFRKRLFPERGEQFWRLEEQATS